MCVSSYTKPRHFPARMHRLSSKHLRGPCCAPGLAEPQKGTTMLRFTYRARKAAQVGHRLWPSQIHRTCLHGTRFCSRMGRPRGSSSKLGRARGSGWADIGYPATTVIRGTLLRIFLPAFLALFAPNLFDSAMEPGLQGHPLKRGTGQRLRPRHRTGVGQCGLTAQRIVARRGQFRDRWSYQESRMA